MRRPGPPLPASALANLRHIMPPGVTNRQHIHVVVRTPNGNDYGKDLLRQHYERHPHGTSGGTGSRHPD